MKQDNQRQAVLYAYLAGIIDGEGTIRIGRANHIRWNTRYSAAISVGITNEKIIDLLVKCFGSKKRIERIPSRKIMYRWGTSGNKVVPQILKKLLPYLQVKKEQAKLVIRFCENSKHTGFRRNKFLPKKELQWRMALWQKVRNLNH